MPRSRVAVKLSGCGGCRGSIGYQGKRAPKPEGTNLAGFVWVEPQPTLDRHAVPVLDLMRRAQPKKGALIGLLHGEGDPEGSKCAQQCVDAFNTKSAGKRVAVWTVPADEDKPVAARAGVPERVSS